MVEILRVVYVGAEHDQQRILGGAQRLLQLLWQHAPEQLTHWPAGTSLASLHDGSPRGAVPRIRRADGPDNRIEVTDPWGRTSAYPAVVATCQSWLLSARIYTDESLFSHPLWTAIERTHYMQSSKTFVVVDRPFWKDIDSETGQHVLSTTLTDRLTRGTYLLDDGPEKPTLICLSYTWNDDALKWLPLDVDERVRLMLHSLKQIYPNVDIASHIIGDPVTISWEDDPDFIGAFSDNLPGHYRYQERLYTHFMQDRFDPDHRGIFLAGDDVSWTGGWAEGAVTTGLNAVWGVMTQLGGKTSATNPGPGDRFEELRSIRLSQANSNWSTKSWTSQPLLDTLDASRSNGAERQSAPVMRSIPRGCTAGAGAASLASRLEQHHVGVKRAWCSPSPAMCAIPGARPRTE